MTRHYLSPSMKKILQHLLDEEEDIVAEGLSVWAGEMQTNWRIVYSLLRLALIHQDEESRGGFNRFEVRETDAREALEKGYIERPW